MFQFYCGSYTEKWVQNIVGQIEKQIEVIKDFYHMMKKLFFRKLFKIESVYYSMKSKFKI
jgi:hypothetical protein